MPTSICLAKPIGPLVRALNAAVYSIERGTEASPTAPRTRCAPSPRRGEGGGEGGRIYREILTPHPTPLPMGEGADRASLELDA